MNKKIELIIIVVLIIAIIAVLSFWLINKKQLDSLSNLDNKESNKKIDINSNNIISNEENPDNYTLIFAIQADPHMDENSDEEIYKQTLMEIASSKSAFLIDLGDIFMTDKLSDKSDNNIRSRYVLMKSFYDLIGSIPLYFVMGNHDGEAGWDSFNTKKYRMEYFQENTYEKNYYSFERNNSLFIMLDPFSFTEKKPNEGWGWTLGKVQYDWLKETLENSNAKYKFVFIHHLVGGDKEGRGGIEFGKLYEWGGNNFDGSYGFNIKRSGWEKPIHQLFIDNNVDIVFKGHDHFYAKQELDGIVYQTLPQPSHPGNTANTASKYGYVDGNILPGSGYLRVKVSEENATVEYIRISPTESKEIAYSYTI